ncbi:MAG TPA: hypothetical protein VN636_19640 [Acidimicrobiia bacterium]|nr:hypothetical protein [Acidimicrobiia bacterium]
MDFEQRQIALVIARARAINGLVMLFLPGLVGRAVFGKAGAHPAVRAVLRLVGVRDLVLGVGAITTLKEQTMDAEWVGMGAVCDAVDGVVCLFTPGLGARARLVSLVGGGSATVGLLAARALADARVPEAPGSEIDT